MGEDLIERATRLLGEAEIREAKLKTEIERWGRLFEEAQSLYEETKIEAERWKNELVDAHAKHYALNQALRADRDALRAALREIRGLTMTNSSHINAMGDIKKISKRALQASEGKHQQQGEESK